MTVGIQTSNTIEEYWYQGGTTEQHLVKKQTVVEVDATPTQNSPNAVSSGGVKTALDDKQNTISDLSTIRSGAAAGATALQQSDITPIENALEDISENYLKAGQSAGTGSVDFDDFADTVHNVPQTLSSS